MTGSKTNAEYCMGWDGLWEPSMKLHAAICKDEYAQSVYRA
jgi:hypothetical protein